MPPPNRRAPYLRRQTQRVGLNGIDPDADGQEWEERRITVASSPIDREETTLSLRLFLPNQ